MHLHWLESMHLFVLLMDCLSSAVSALQEQGFLLDCSVSPAPRTASGIQWVLVGWAFTCERSQTHLYTHSSLFTASLLIQAIPNSAQVLCTCCFFCPRHPPFCFLSVTLHTSGCSQASLPPGSPPDFSLMSHRGISRVSCAPCGNGFHEGGKSVCSLFTQGLAHSWKFLYWTKNKNMNGLRIIKSCRFWSDHCICAGLTPHSLSYFILTINLRGQCDWPHFTDKGIKAQGRPSVVLKGMY